MANSTQAKVALITGAARGIGLATAHLMAEDGWQVALLDRDADALKSAAAEFDGKALDLLFDVSDPQAAPQAIRACLDHFGRLDALVNNAGVADFGPIEETDFARWRRRFVGGDLQLFWGCGWLYVCRTYGCPKPESCC